jgi:hypothetical protein
LFRESVGDLSANFAVRWVMQEIQEPQIFEEVYTTDELARVHKLHPSTIRKLFQKEPGVIVLRLGPNSERSHYRIPRSVAVRVFSRLALRTS